MRFAVYLGNTLEVGSSRFFSDHMRRLRFAVYPGNTLEVGSNRLFSDHRRRVRSAVYPGKLHSRASSLGVSLIRASMVY